MKAVIISNKNKLTIMINILFILFMITAVSYTFAYFSETEQGTGTITFGKVELNIAGTDVERIVGTNTYTIDVSQKRPGDTIVDNQITIGKTSGSESCYVAFRVTFIDTSTGSILTNYVNELQALADDSQNLISYTDGSTYKYVLENEWFLLSDYSGNMLNVTTTSTYNLFDLTDFVIPLQLSEMANNAQYNQTISLFIEFNAIQSINILVNDAKAALAPNLETITGTVLTSSDARLTYTVPSSVTSIGTSAFADNVALTKAVIPSTVTSIGTNAFDNCTNATIFYEGSVAAATSLFTSSVNPDGRPIICYSVSGGNATIIGAVDKTKLFNVDLPEYLNGSTLTTLGSYCFYNCDNLVNINFPSTLTTILSEALYDNASLKSLYIPASVLSIDLANPFAYSFSLETIKVSDSNPNYKAVDNVLFSKDGTVLLRYASKKIGSVYNIPSTVTRICSRAFSYNHIIEYVNFPSSVTTIDSYALYYCMGLKEVYLPNTITSMASGNPFGNCQNLEKIELAEGSTYLKSVGGVLFSYDGKYLRSFPMKANIENYTVPDGVQYIYPYAFCSAKTYLKTVTLPSSLISILSCAFQGCYKLETVTFTGLNLTNIFDYVFSSCIKLNNIVIPSSVTNINVYAFTNCTELTQIYINRVQADYASMTLGTNWNGGKPIYVWLHANGGTEAGDTNYVDYGGYRYTLAA